MCPNYSSNVSGNSVTVSLGSILLVFLELARGVSQHPLSCWINITAYSIPEAEALPLCTSQADFICPDAVGDEDNMLYLLYCSFCADMVTVFTQSPMEKWHNKREQADPDHFLSLETGRSHCRHSPFVIPRVDVYRSALGFHYLWLHRRTAEDFISVTNTTDAGK